MCEIFGAGDGTCADCCHLRSGYYGDRKLRKCYVYGMTHSEASDWALSYPACGQKNKPYHGEMIIRMKPRSGMKKQEIILDGQAKVL